MASNAQTAFTRETQRKLTILRVVAYSLATIFMIVMAGRAVWITRNQMEAEADRSIRSAAAAIDLGVVEPAGAQALLRTLAPTGVTMRLETGTGITAESQNASPEIRTVALVKSPAVLVATIDHDAIWQGALSANRAFIGFILALGLPVIAIFLYMGWLINRPALQLLAFAQAGQDEDRYPPNLPVVWSSVLERLKQLKDSQAQMQAFLDNAPIGMSFFDPAGRVMMMNRYGAGYYGQRPEELVGKEMIDFVPYYPEAQSLSAPLLIDPLTKAETTTVETEFHSPSGEHFVFRITSFPVLGVNGKVDLVGTYFVDITGQRRAETDLGESRALFEAFIQNAPNPMALMDATGHYVMLNNATARYYDMTADALLAAGPKVIHSRFPEARNVIAPMLGRVMATLEGEQVDTLFETPSGDIRDMAFAFFPILGPDGKLAFIGNISHDMTDERRTRSELAQSKDSLHQAEKLAALGSMLAGVSHELNNPLAAVIGQAALLGEDLDGTEHADRIAKIRRAADRCARIVQSFLAMARQKAPEYRSVNLNDQVRAAIELTEYQMRAANIVLDLKLQQALPTIDADPDQLHQVIVNLLTNARQAMEDIEGDRVITVTTSCTRKTITLSVADTGVGIDAATRQRIFDPFFTTKEVGTGTGIGLSYSLGIIEAHGGTIGIEDAAVGTVFVITLPVDDQETGAATAVPKHAAKAKGRALVIDDEADVAETLADMLARMGLDVTVAIGGQAGQAVMAGGAAFDLILSDIRMPEFDGPSLYAWMAEHRSDLTGVVAFVTGDTLSGHAAEFLGASQRPVLEKPFTPEGLKALVAEILEQKEGEVP